MSAIYGLDDCPWYDVPVIQRPWWARRDCGGMVEDTYLGVICEVHLNAGVNDVSRKGTGCQMRRTSLGGGVICAVCGDDCECVVCLPQGE